MLTVPSVYHSLTSRLALKTFKIVFSVVFNAYATKLKKVMLQTTKNQFGDCIEPATVENCHV